MRSSKNRSRSKSNRQRSLGNIINRVFDSSGPESKVRGTPQQIIEKYLMLARDAQLSNDRVAEQNFLQHAEHYTRMLSEAQRELAREQEGRQGQPGQGQQGQSVQAQQDGNGNGFGHGYDGNGNGGGNGGGQAAASPAGAPYGERDRGGDRDRGPERGSERGPDRGAERQNDRSGQPRPRQEDRGDDRPRYADRAPRSTMMPMLNADAADEGPGLVETPEARLQERTAPAAVDASSDADAAARKPASRGPRKPRAKTSAAAPAPAEKAEGGASDATE